MTVAVCTDKIAYFIKDFKGDGVLIHGQKQKNRTERTITSKRNLRWEYLYKEYMRTK